MKTAGLAIFKPGDPGFEEWNDRGFNLRLKGIPKSIIPVRSTLELTEALNAALDQHLHVVVRGGGHCLENFVSDPAVEMIIDISGMRGIRHDPEMNAIEVMSGETVGDIHKKLYDLWNIVLPMGEHPDIGIGGHIPGGAFGFLCRKLGLGVDYLYAVEVIWVNGNRKPEKTIATRETHDPNRELWWAHTGGGTGNFGIVTRFWFRAAQVSGDQASGLLPQTPAEVETIEIDWDWKDINEIIFTALVQNFGAWIAAHSGEGIIAREIYGKLILSHQETGKIKFQGLITDTTHSDFILNDLIHSVHPLPALPYQITRKKTSWLKFMRAPFWGDEPGYKVAFKFKDAFLLKPFSDYQVKAIYHNLTTGTDLPGAAVVMTSYGGKVNEIPAGLTATAQRNAILTTSFTPVWFEPADKDKYMAWARACYQDVFAESGGAPVPGEIAGGCIIAHPDNDLADPEWNKSGIPWHRFYYLDYYPRLQQIKDRWDPLDIFHHTLSVKGSRENK